ncbi:MAG: FtsX-like permease family protein [Mycobacterium leprae]
MLKLAWRFIASRRVRSLTGIVSILLGTALLAALLVLGRSLQLALDQAMAPQYSTLRMNIESIRPLGYGLGIAAMLAAAFLLSASFRIALTERRRELALLRTIGATPAQVRLLLLVEGLLLGAVGSVLGVSLGLGAALLSAREAAIILGVQPGPVVIPWAPLVEVGIAGILLTLFSAWRVAQIAGKTTPLEALRPDLAGQVQEARQGGLFGLLLAAAGAIAVAATPWVPDRIADGLLRVLTGALGGLAIGLGLLLGIPRLLPLLLPVFTYPWRNRQAGTLAVRALLRHRRRSGLTVGATALGLILVVAVGTFSVTLMGRWADDVRIQHPTDVAVRPYIYPGRMPATLAEQVAQIPGVTKVVPVGDSEHTLLMEFDHSRLSPAYAAKMAELQAEQNSLGIRPPNMPDYWEFLHVYPADPASLAQIGAIRLVGGTLTGFDETGLALSTEIADGLRLKVGDQITLNVNQKAALTAVKWPEPRTFRVRAIYKTDLQPSIGAIVAQPLPGSPGDLQNLYASVAPGQMDAVRTQIRQLLTGEEYKNAKYSDYEQAMAEFRAQTYQRLFLVLAVGLVMGAVAAMSLLNTMASSVNERRREFALLRSVGATPRQVHSVVLVEACLLGLVGGLVGIIGGTTLGSGALMGLDLPKGWLRLPWQLMAAGLGISLLLALAAAAGPARRVAHRSPAEAMRQE